MDDLKYLIFALLGGLALVTLVQAQDQSGFISLDCGLPEDTSYTEPTLTLRFTSDAAYINSGISKSLSSNYQKVLSRQYHHVRSFPQGRRNCYNISIRRDTKYLMRASFLYGNYDGLGKLPMFDLYFGDSLWRTMNLTDESIDATIDTIYVTSNNQIQICLVNTNNGTPFISSLEFRPLPNETYEVQSRSLLLQIRFDYGTTTNKTYRFPDDIHDRFWVPFSWYEWTSISTMLAIDSGQNNYYQPGSAVMGTAAIRINTSKPLEIWWESDDENTQYYVFMHFAEVEDLKANQTRGFNITYNGNLWYGPLIPNLYTTTIFNPLPSRVPTKKHLFSLVPIENSTLPPIINAIEIYSPLDLSELASNQGDVDVIRNIKSTYGILKDWVGDPCVPREYPWEGIDCTYETTPRIVSLNLSSSGLAGEISSYISNLEMIQTLDLSNNNLTGNIPTFLSKLSNLKVLKLEHNKLTGLVPPELIRKFDDGSLLLSVEGNPNLDACLSDSCVKKSKKNNVVIPIVASIGGLVAIAAIATIIFWIVRSKKKRQNETAVSLMDHSESKNQSSDLLETKRRQFTFSEVLKMTKNFERVLGKGGFGMVYYGLIDDVQVAVKLLSQASDQGYQQFQAEVKLLLRVHHKNLTSLVGYLNEGDHLGLIYEFMKNGNLAEHLSENSSRVLSWQDRLRIATDAAQGLEYLHDGCKPPIVHRDVKTTNILLTENFQAKLADFGLSKSFPTEGNNTYMSTVVAGTFGYLDPEYYKSNRLTEKSDVYSFGVALMEIISCRPVIAMNDKNVHISKWVKSMLAKGDINGIVDRRLNNRYDVNSVWNAVEIAVNCVSENSGERPMMSQVVAQLKNCLAIEMDRTPESRASNQANFVHMTSIVMDESESVPMAR
ncbi:LRR receptor-like serine/threonine-protein kinase IOS1 [Momordica charantia]|uniref:non-specific serine/threonine protein kinase n=1 Tax=Momordica charantia TaxID=3673 RepID=A0A6J1CS68_MOMCH|nr:LRR receptor-like serine/threonine-protein kinase IOS1 [Momordica charantia]